jgi:hypothetical protein
MPLNTLFAAERRLDFPYSPDAGLYRDPAGKWIIADVDGPAVAAVGCQLVPIPSGSYWSPTDPGGPSAAVNVLLGRTTVPEGVSRTVTLPYTGAGWWLNAPGPVQLDDDSSPVDAGGLPTPFFRRIQGEGEATIIPADRRCLELIRAAADAPKLLPGYAARGVSRVVPTGGSWWPGGRGEVRPILSHMNALSFFVEVPAGAVGLRIERTYDRFHGRQRARLLVDEEFCGWWYDPGEDRHARWARSSCGAELTPAETDRVVRITIDPPAGVALWTWAELAVFALTPCEPGAPDR